MYRRENPFPQRRRTPSFSSSLLDAIYRSIDESHDADADTEQDLSFYCEKSIIRNKKHRNYGAKPVEEANNNIRRAIMIENWMEKQSSLRSTCLHFNNSTSTTTSSDSSSGVGAVFSSSEAESNYKDRSRRSKPVRSMKCMQSEKRIIEENHYHQQKPKPKSKPNPNPNREGGFSKTKLKALKIYGELKKVKQPISPGGRITSFLNSIFSSGNGKKVNVCTVKAMEDVNFDSKSKSGCSSAPSFSRSCLSKTPPSSSSCRSGKHRSSSNSNSNSNNIGGSNGMKRSVRFYPVSVIVDEDCKPCGHKRIHEDDPSLLPSRNLKLDELIKNKETGVRTLVDEEDDEDDALSYSSSDLFELDHLKGIGRYREELPVYETTNLKKNQAIANRFIL